MLNKLLGFFGLMKISRAKKITTTLHVHYVQCVQNGVFNDFGIPPKINHIEKERGWWNEELDAVMIHDSDDVIITNPPFFKRERNET